MIYGERKKLVGKLLVLVLLIIANVVLLSGGPKVSADNSCISCPRRRACALSPAAIPKRSAGGCGFAISVGNRNARTD